MDQKLFVAKHTRTFCDSKDVSVQTIYDSVIAECVIRVSILNVEQLTVILTITPIKHSLKYIFFEK